MDEERNPPFFPLRTQTRSACQPPALLSGLPASPPRSRTIGQTDGRTDGRTDSAGPARPGAGARAGRAGGDVGVSAGCPLPTARPRPGGGCLGILFFSSSLPVRSLAAGAAPAPWTPMGVGEALTPTRLWQRRQRGSETPPPPGKCRLCSPPGTGPQQGVLGAPCSVGALAHLHPPSGCPPPLLGSQRLPLVLSLQASNWGPCRLQCLGAAVGCRTPPRVCQGQRGCGIPRPLFGCQMGGARPPEMWVPGKNEQDPRLLDVGGKELRYPGPWVPD